mmetsp:Transcript_95782/g.154495  ORF Transcript_95782/g.154495 Transcript_95782/m.154495 type:complete len:159 (-) Transcript_95782:1061-1537(-)
MMRLQGTALAVLLLPCLCFSAHPTNSALLLASRGMRLRESLSLRGGGEVPGVQWSQRQDSLMIKVEVPAGASLDHLTVSGDGDVLEWADEKVTLNLGLYGKLDQSSVVKVDAGRQVTLNAKKATPEWWPKLTQGPKPTNVKVDWASWKDEDEDAEGAS